MPAVIPGKAVPLFDGVVRWTAPNPGFMTGPGTNSYIIGKDALTIIDPGPIIDENIAAMLDYCGDRIERVIVTHTHRDHCPAAMPLAKAARVPVFGTLPPPGEENDASFAPDVELTDGQLIDCDALTIESIHTPGHASNHFCFLVIEHGLLLTGDHVMNGSTVVIAAPDGNMREYLDSLALLKRYALVAIAPGHGDLLNDAVTVIDWIVAHRLEREAKVIDRLRKLEPCTLEVLLPAVYNEVDTQLLPVARYSLVAHLDKLREDGEIQKQGDVWCLAGQDDVVP